jgi:hypothetical protein
VNTTGLPSDDLALDMEIDLRKDDLFSTRTRRFEFVLLSALSLLATIATITIFGTHVNTWLSSISIAVAGK